MGFASQELQSVWKILKGKIQLGRFSARCLFSCITMEKGGLMGKVASDKCHKWVFKEPTESEPNISNYWQSSFDALPPEWTDQFASGIQTIAVIQAGHGLLQLGSCNIIAEDLHFVLRMRHTFESLGYQSGFFLSQLFSATQTGPSPSSSNHVKPVNMNRPLPILNWNTRPIHHGNMPTPIPHPNFSNSSARRNIGDEPHLFLPLPHAPSPGMDEMMTDHENDIKWPNGLSFFSALTGRVEESKLLFGSDSMGEFGNGSRTTKTMQQFGIGKNGNSNSNMSIGSDMDDNSKAMSEGSNGYMGDETSVAEYLSLESHGHHNAERLKRMERFKRSFTMPARMASAEMTHVRPVMDYRTPEHNGVYSDIIGNFLE